MLFLPLYVPVLVLSCKWILRSAHIFEKDDLFRVVNLRLSQRDQVGRCLARSGVMMSLCLCSVGREVSILWGKAQALSSWKTWHV